MRDLCFSRQFSEATIGDNETSKPGMLDLKGKYKWEAWQKNKGKSQEDARREYVDLVNQLKSKWINEQTVSLWLSVGSNAFRSNKLSKKIFFKNCRFLSVEKEKKHKETDFTKIGQMFNCYC